MTRRTRTLPYELGSSSQITRNEYYLPFRKTEVTRRFDKLRTIKGSQVTDSEGHQWNSRKAGDFTDRGGNFFTQKKFVECPFKGSPTVEQVAYLPNLPASESTSTYQGPAWIPGIDVTGKKQFPPASNSSDSQLNQLGATAISMCKPTNSLADIGTTLGELITGGLPRLSIATWEEIARTANKKKAGGEYLNVQYGWAPLVKDLSQFLYSVARAGALMRQLQRDAGKVVRRRFEFTPSVTSSWTVINEGSEWPEMGTYNTRWFKSPLSWTVSRERVISQRRWFSGAFTYYMPPPDKAGTLEGYAQTARTTLGLKLTPDVVWNLLPWSWAVDWFSNVGDVISNIADKADHGLVVRYGYMMEHTIVTDTYTALSSPFKNEGAVIPLKMVTETKIRRKANPFGFGVSWSGLSPFQLSIAAALGLSRS